MQKNNSTTPRRLKPYLLRQWHRVSRQLVNNDVPTSRGRVMCSAICIGLTIHKLPVIFKNQTRTIEYSLNLLFTFFF